VGKANCTNSRKWWNGGKEKPIVEEKQIQPKGRGKARVPHSTFKFSSLSAIELERRRRALRELFGCCLWAKLLPVI
jgi:hypothetical protein